MTFILLAVVNWASRSIASFFHFRSKLKHFFSFTIVSAAALSGLRVNHAIFWGLRDDIINLILSPADFYIVYVCWGCHCSSSIFLKQLKTIWVLVTSRLLLAVLFQTKHNIINIILINFRNVHCVVHFLFEQCFLFFKKRQYLTIIMYWNNYKMTITYSFWEKT